MTNQILLKRWSKSITGIAVSITVALAVGLFAAGDALAKHGHGGGGGGGGGGGNSGGRSSSDRGGSGGHSGGSHSSSGRSSSGHSSSGQARSFSGGSPSGSAGSSHSSQAYRSMQKSGGDNSSPRTFSNQGQRLSWSKSGDQSGKQGDSSQSNQLRRIGPSGGNSGDSAAGQSQVFSNKQFKAGSGDALSTGRHSVNRPNDDQLRSMLKNKQDDSSRDVQANFLQSQQGKNRNNDNDKTDSGDRGRNWAKGGKSAEGQQAVNDLNNKLNRGPQTNLGSNDDKKRTGDRDGRNWDRSKQNWSEGGKNGNGPGKNFNQQALNGQLRRGDNAKSGDHDGNRNWSKKDGNTNRQTQKWFANSGFGDNRGKSDKHNRDHDAKFGDQVRNNWNNDWRNKHGDHDNHDHHDVPFANKWWDNHNHNHNHWAHHQHWHHNHWNDWNNDFFWWGWSTAPLLTTWVDFGWNYPCYWDYGPGEYIYYYNNAVYVDDEPYATTLDYYSQVFGLAHSVPDLSPEQLANVEWMPMGVFAVTRPGAAGSNELIQMAVSKDGMLSGTLFNQQTGKTRPLEGMVEQATQRAAWCYGDVRDSLVVETSLYNLTESQCTVLAHLGPVSTEVWQLVRLEQPPTQQ